MASVTLSWNADPVTDNVTDYQIWGANGTSIVFGSCVLLATITGLTWTDIGLPNNQTRTYYIVAQNAVGSSSPEGPINITTATASVQTPNVQTVTSAATVTPTFSNDQVNLTAQAAGLTLANPTGTAVPAWGMVIRIKDNGTAQTIAYGTQYRAIGITLPTTTVISKTLYLAMIYNSTDTKWDVVAVAQEA